MNELVFNLPMAELLPVAPIAVLLIGALVAVVSDSFTPRPPGEAATEASPAAFTTVAPYITLASALLSCFLVLYFWSEAGLALQRSLILGPFSALMASVVLIVTGLAGAYVAGYLQDTAVQTGEYQALLLCSAAGGITLVAAHDLVTMFLAIELLSLSVYALVGIARDRPTSAEGGMKYFVMGAFSSGFLLYGMAMVYGGSGGSIYLSEMAPGHNHSLYLVGGALMLIGFLFKIGAVPFHAWAPDAYEGAPAAVTGYMAVTVKLAAFAALLRTLTSLSGVNDPFGMAPAALGSFVRAWPEVIWVVAALSVMLGNLAALTQRNPRRMLAYSAIAHTGYALVGLTAFGRNMAAVVTSKGEALAPGLEVDALAATAFYVVTYGAMSLGAFAVLVATAYTGEDCDSLDDLTGLSRRRPLTAAAMTLFMVSLIGIPPTAGFIGKLWIFQTAVRSHLVGLVVLSLLTTAISVYYYLRVVVVMYMAPTHQPRSEASDADVSSWGQDLAIALSALCVLLVGLMPASGLEIAKAGAKNLLTPNVAQLETDGDDSRRPR